MINPRASYSVKLYAGDDYAPYEAAWSLELALVWLGREPTGLTAREMMLTVHELESHWERDNGILVERTR